MVYKRNIPQPGDTLGQSAREMRENYKETFRHWLVDHYSLIEEDWDKRGKHRTLTQPEQSSPPATAASELALYSEAGQDSDVKWRLPSNGASATLLSERFVALGGLKLEAYCTFNADNGEFLKAPTPEISEDGTVVDGLRDIKSFNVTSVTPNASEDPTAFTINFSPDLSSANYFVSINTYKKLRGTSNVNAIVGLKNNATYSDTCTAAKCEIECRRLTGANGLIAANRYFTKIQVNIWTVTA